MERIVWLLEQLVEKAHPALLWLRSRLLSGVRFDMGTAMDLMRRFGALSSGKGLAADMKGALLRGGALLLLALAAAALVISLLKRLAGRRRARAHAKIPALLLTLPYGILIVWLAISLGFAGSALQALSALPDAGRKAVLVLLAAQSLVAVHRFAFGRTASAVVQTLGILPLAAGALLLQGLGPMQLAMLADEAVAAAVLIALGLIFVLWRMLDVFLVLFGGLGPKDGHGRG